MRKLSVVFTPQHLEYLERVFAEDVDIKDTNQLYRHQGIRSVVKHIEHLVRASQESGTSNIKV
jgi:hypothetical protein